MRFRITYTACQSPLGNQPVANLLALGPVAHIFSGDYVYNDSGATYTINGYSMPPTIFWDFVATPTGAPPNAHTAAYAFDRFDRHYGRNGLRDYRLLWAARDAGKLLVYGQGDDHDCGYNNQDHSLQVFKDGFPIATNGAYGQVVNEATFTQAQNRQVWLAGQAGMTLIEQQYFDNPPRGAPNGDVPIAMVGTASPEDYPVRYFFRDFDANGKLTVDAPVLRVIFPDSISYKSPAADPDTLGKQFWGTQQEAWIVQTVADGNARGIRSMVIASTKDLYNLDNNDGPWTYSARRDALLTAIETARGNASVMWLTGDKHVPHAGMATVANGQPCDVLCVCACPFGQGIGNLTQYKENIWYSGRNDQCVIGMIEVDVAQATTTLSIIDAWTLDPLFSAVVPWGQQLPSRINTNVGQVFKPQPSTARQVVTVGASPFVLQNTTTKPMAVVIKGGTVSTIEFSRDNATWDDTGANKGQFILAPGDWLRTNYSVAPTTFATYAMP